MIWSSIAIGLVANTNFTDYTNFPFGVFVFSLQTLFSPITLILVAIQGDENQKPGLMNLAWFLTLYLNRVPLFKSAGVCLFEFPKAIPDRPVPRFLREFSVVQTYYISQMACHSLNSLIPAVCKITEFLWVCILLYNSFLRSWLFYWLF